MTDTTVLGPEHDQCVLANNLLREQLLETRLAFERERASRQDWAAEAMRLDVELAHAQARLRMACGACHPCNNWPEETWHRAGRKPPTFEEWQLDKTQLRNALQLLESLSSPSPCRLDHHGYCQEHGWVSGSDWTCQQKRIEEVLGR